MFVPADPAVVTKALWAALHGVVSHQLQGHFSSLEEAKDVYELTAFAVIASFIPGILKQIP